MMLIQVLSESGEGPNTELLWILGILLGFFALTILVGWTAGSGRPRQAQAESEPYPLKPAGVGERGKIAKATRPSRGGGRKR